MGNQALRRKLAALRIRMGEHAADFRGLLDYDHRSETSEEVSAKVKEPGLYAVLETFDLLPGRILEVTFDGRRVWHDSSNELATSAAP